jgi:menaquinone-9 beta-reductase
LLSKRGDVVNHETAYDAVVIGAGPAGSSTAFHLAKKGWRVALFEKSRMPRDKACGDGLGTGSVAMLKSMDVAPLLEGFPQITGVDIKVRGESTCTSSFRPHDGSAYGLVVPRRELDLLIANRAREAGSDWYEGSRVTGFGFSSGRVSSVQYVTGREQAVRTRFVVIADGGGSNLSAQAGIPKHSAETVGYAIRGYFRNVPVHSAFFNIHLPINRAGMDRVVPGYGWVFPLKDSCANIGVGYYPCQRQDRTLNLRQLFTRFLGELVQTEPAMAEMQLMGKWTGGTLRSGMDPSRCFANGAIVVGDAAGLVDPFTGEGIDTALVSGQYAAEALDSALKRDNTKCLREYSHLLERRYSDRFQLGDRFVKTYSFMWKLVQTTVDHKCPLFDKIRQGLFNYQGSALDPVGTVIDSDLGSFQRRVTAEMRKVATSDFPVFARLAMLLHDQRAASLRQALAFWCHQIAGAERDDRLVTVSACLELAKLAHSVQAEVIDGTQVNHWGNSFAVMCGNYLLTKAFGAIQPMGHDITRIVACVAGVLCRQEIDASFASEDNSQGSKLRTSAEIESRFVGAVARIACCIAGGPQSLQEALESYGELLGKLSCESCDWSGPILRGPARQEAEAILSSVPQSHAKRQLLMLEWNDLHSLARHQCLS